MGELGIDVSDHNVITNWDTVYSWGYDFVYVKGNEGTSTVYPSCSSQLAGARAAGLLTGLYHYAQFSNSPFASAAAFAEVCIENNALSAESLTPCIDMETCDDQNADNWLNTFAHQFALITGYYGSLMIYASAELFIDEQISDDGGWWLWVASWGSPLRNPTYLSPRVALHQFTNQAGVPGIEGSCDASYSIQPISAITVTP